MQFNTSAPRQLATAKLLRPPVRKPTQGNNERSLLKHRLSATGKYQEGGSTVVIADFEANVRLTQIALDPLKEEFEAWVVTDACSSRN